MRTEGFRGALLATLVIASIIALAILLLSSSPVHAALTPHDPIYIDGNDNFTPANGVVGGSGTENDPYIIENWDISAENTHGIEIRNTTAHFVIRNSYVHDGLANWKYGIRFEYVTNGRIDNNIVENNSYGISLNSSDNNTLTNNNVSNNDYLGIVLSDSDNNTLSNNTCENNITFGISLNESDNNLVENNTAWNNYYGIYLGYSYNNFVTNNLAENNYWGTYFRNSNNNLVSNNTCENNHFGIFLWLDSNGNHIHRNNFINNENQAHDDGSNYWDNGYPWGGNYWSDYTGADIYRGEDQNLSGSDGIGDTPYYIPGDNNRDRYPFMYPYLPTKVIVRGKDTAYSVNDRAPPPWKEYNIGDRPPLMAVRHVGSGAVAAAGFAPVVRDGQWNHPENPDNHLPELLDASFQWMVPGATKVLWYEGYGVFNTVGVCGTLVTALGDLGYTITGDSTEPITSSLLAPYDIMVISQMQLPYPPNPDYPSGNPDLLPDADVQAIKNFVEGGGGLLIMEATDYFDYKYSDVQNKILLALDFDYLFQDDSVYDDTNNIAGSNYRAIVDVDDTTEIGAAYYNLTGKTTIGLYGYCSLTYTLWTGTTAFSLVNLYTVNIEKILDLYQGLKLVVKFYTYGDAFEDENVIENFSPPLHVEENESARHPEGIGVKKARLDLTTDDTSNVISTIASFTVRKIHLGIRFTEIPLEWALASPAERVELEIEFSQIPLYWALAPS